jgi:hypothetical protein
MGTRKQHVKIDGVWQTFPPPYSPGGRTLSRMMRPDRRCRKGFRADWRKFKHLPWRLRWIKPAKKHTYWEGRETCAGSGALRSPYDSVRSYCIVCRHWVLNDPTTHPNTITVHTRAKRFESK